MLLQSSGHIFDIDAHVSLCVCDIDMGVEISLILEKFLKYQANKWFICCYLPNILSLEGIMLLQHVSKKVVDC